MSENFRIFAVDDDPLVLDVIGGILAPAYPIETFASVAACTARLETAKPDMFLLDVRMPGTDGYTFCRSIKDDPALAQIPVTFVSSNDTIDARLKGYDAGGEDFIVKPFQPEEILRKVKVAQQIAGAKQTLKQQLEDSELLSSLVMANMDEYAILVRFIRELVSWNNEQEIAVGVLEMLQRYRLAGVVQTRISNRTVTLSDQGAELPLEVSVMNHVRGMERIFEFRNRSVQNFERVTMMVKNMPLEDPDYCGRLRDHLCIAAETTEARLKAIETEEASRRSQAGIQNALTHITAITDELQRVNRENRIAISELMIGTEQQLSSAFMHVGLTEDQEGRIGRIVSNFMKDLVEMLDRSEDTEKPLQALGQLLGALSPTGR